MVGAPRVEHLKARGIGAHDVRRAHADGQPLDQGLDTRAHARNPIGQRRHRNVGATARVDSMHAMQGGVISELAHDDVCEERRVRGRARQHLRRRRCGDHGLLAPRARPLLAMRLLLDKVARHVLQPARHIDAEASHRVVTGGTRLVLGRHFDHVHVALDARGAPSRVGLARLPSRSRRAGATLFRVGDLAIERGVLAHLGIGIERLGGGALGEQGVEQQGDLARVEPLGVTTEPLTSQFQHQELELAVFHEDRVERGQEELPRFVDLALREQRLRALTNLCERRSRGDRVHRCARLVGRAARVRACRSSTINCALIASSSAIRLLNALPLSTRARTSSTVSVGTCTTRLPPSAMKVSVHDGWPCGSVRQ